MIIILNKKKKNNIKGKGLQRAGRAVNRRPAAQLGPGRAMLKL